MISLKNGRKQVVIDRGELVSILVDGHEYIHQKGSPGWGSSDTEMFPIIGPVDQNNFRVSTARGGAIQDQHGLLRQFAYEKIMSSEDRALFRKGYQANTRIKNSKYPQKSTEEWLTWPYSFQFEKHYHLQDWGLEITFSVSGDQQMPFMLGYHPAFKLYSEAPLVKAGDTEITLEQVMAVGDRAWQLANCNSVILKDEKSLTIETEGFGHFMCWAPVRNMICLEPISFYPYQVQQKNLHQGFEFLNKEPRLFKVYLKLT